MSETTLQANTDTDQIAWRDLIEDHRAGIASRAFTVTVDEDTEKPLSWLELPRPNSDFDICAAQDVKTGRWDVLAYLSGGSLTTAEALAASEALTEAARQAEAMNTPEWFSIPLHHFPKEVIGKLGSVVSLIASEHLGIVAIRLDLRRRWAERCTEPGARWTWTDEDYPLESTNFEYIGDFIVSGLDVKDAANQRVILTSAENHA